MPMEGVIVDVCRNHGVWFDAGEFEHFTAFARAGGLEVIRHDEIAAAEAARRAALAAAEPAPVHVGGFPRRSGDAVLADAVLRGLAKILRGIF